MGLYKEFCTDMLQDYGTMFGGSICLLGTTLFIVSSPLLILGWVFGKLIERWVRD